MPLPLFADRLVRPFGNGWAGCWASLFCRTFTTLLYLLVAILFVSFAASIIKTAQEANDGGQTFSDIWRQEMAAARERNGLMRAATAAASEL